MRPLPGICKWPIDFRVGKFRIKFSFSFAYKGGLFRELQSISDIS